MTSALLLVLALQEGPDFALDVLPVLTRSGCNAGACHGSAKGQGGFKLSLLGDDADADYDAVAWEFGSRRIHRGRPEASLLLRKGQGRVDHEGGRALRDPEGVVAGWIRGGARRKSRDVRLLGVAADPAWVLGAPGGGASLRVEARYSDGTRRDVGGLALYGSNDDSVATVDGSGAVRLRASGETCIVVRYGGFVVPVRAAAPFGASPAGFAAAGPVDDALLRHWTALGIRPAPKATDAVFLRRAHLDLIGTLPTAQEVRSFLANPDRAALVERLLARPEFDDFWTLKLSQLLLVGAKRFPEAYPDWLRSRLDRPLTETAALLVTSLGTEAPAAYFSVSSDPRVMMEFTMQNFHGFRIQCANCHDHPLERFPQDDYHALASVFARVRHDGGSVILSPRGELVNPRTGRTAPPRHDGPDRRVPFASALTSDPAFARAWANRLWGELFGRGLVHPVDDLRASNPPSIPGLLEALAEDFGRDPRIRPFLRRLLASNAYGLSSDGESPDRFFARALVRPLPAEVVADAISSASGVSGPRAIARVDPSQGTAFLRDLGRCPRDGACTLQSAFQGSLRQALALATLEVKAPVRDPEELYLRALSRPPRPEERAWAAGVDPDELLWALIASREFQLRH
jgi:hypothetical protein